MDTLGVSEFDEFDGRRVGVEFDLVDGGDDTTFVEKGLKVLDTEVGDFERGIRRGMSLVCCKFPLRLFRNGNLEPETHPRLPLPFRSPSPWSSPSRCQ